MNCKEKWGYTPKEILNMEFGLRDGKSMTHLEMRMDAFQEMQENEHKIMYNSLLSIIDEINISLKDTYKIDYKEIYKNIKKKYSDLYMKERPEISPETIDFLEMPNKNRQIVSYCDNYINGNYIKQSVEQI